MNNTVTREDVIEFLNTFTYSGDFDADMAGEEADALIAAFPHLIGEVTMEHRTGPATVLVDPIPRYSGATHERTVYTVTGPWKDAER